MEDGMDDEAFARMLQQQLLDEELMMAQPKDQHNQGPVGQNHRHSNPSQNFSGQPLPPVGARNMSDPFPSNRNMSDSFPQRRISDSSFIPQQQQQHDPYAAQQDPYYDRQPPNGSNYNQPSPSNYQQPPPPGNYRQPYPNSDYQHPPPSGYQQHPPPSGYQQHPRSNSYQQHPPPSGYQQHPPPSGFQQHPPSGYQQNSPPRNYHQPPPGNYNQPPPDNYQQNHYASDPYQQQQPSPQNDPYARPPPPQSNHHQNTYAPDPYLQQPSQQNDPYARPPPPQNNDPYQQQQQQQRSFNTLPDERMAAQPSSRSARSQSIHEEETDLELARKLHMLEITGQGAMASQYLPSQDISLEGSPPLGPRDSSASGGRVSGGLAEDSRMARRMMETVQGPPLGHRDSSASGGGASGGMTKEEQEAEDSRLARLMMETGQSFRDLDLSPARSAKASSNLPPIPQERTPDPPPQKPSRKPPPPQYSDPAAAEYTPIVPIFPAKGSSLSSVNSRSSVTSTATNPDVKTLKKKPRNVGLTMTRTSGTRNIGPSSSDRREIDPSPLNPAPLAAASATRPVGGRSTTPKTSKDMSPNLAKKRGIFGFGARPSKSNESLQGAVKGLKSDFDDGERPLIPFPIPKPVARPADTIGARKGPLPYSLSVSKNMPKALEATVSRRLLGLGGGVCSACNRPVSNPLTALEKKYHNECFRCITCHEQIDSTGPFAYIESKGDKQPMHRKCYAEMYGIKCAVCKDSIAAGPDGKISFVKHPFFDTEQMCPRHAKNMTRRCTGCHRFEPEREPFADLNDVGRCVCLSCCRTVIVDSVDAQPLWNRVIDFFDQKLNLPIWKDFREVPVLIVGYNALNDQMSKGNNVHGGASQIMTRGLCLTEHESGRRFRNELMKFDKSNKSFVASDAEDRGFTYFQVPDASKVNPSASVTAVLCLSGLPKDLTASVLAHEATHAWIKLHPRFDYQKPIPPQVEEGVAQLIALLFLNEGLDPAPPLEYNDGSGPSDEKLRQYFKFSIETDDHELYGTGYRRAAMAYSMLGIEALMSHIVLYQDFPET